MVITIQLVVISTSIAIFIAIIFLFSSFRVITTSFAQKDSSNNSTDQTMKNVNQSVNQTVNNHLQQDVNQTSELIQENASDGDVSNITEKAKSLGKNITEVVKKFPEKLLIKNERFSKINIHLSLLKKINLKCLSVLKRMRLIV
ncbi:MAG TPA: hypothetical protein VHJ38_20035 [Nitrososphaeraceae archaeon]|jgi:hypothetical protein|nr:hypothetical protein [Nitrososphaeraceae archaeon]